MSTEKTQHDTLFIVGGGPSLIGFDWNKLKHKPVMAINNAYQNVPWAKYLVYGDARWYDLHKEHIENKCFELHTFSRKPQSRANEKSKCWKSTGLSGLETNGGIKTGNNSGYAGINIAVNLGWRRVVLLGFDFCYVGAASHYHGGHSWAHNERTLKSKMAPYFNGLAAELDRIGVEVLNASQISALTCFEKIEL